MTQAEQFLALGRGLGKRHLVPVPVYREPASVSQTVPRPGEHRGFRHYKVSTVGQLTLPASARQRWGIERGGRVAVADLGHAVVIVPEHGVAALFDEWLSPELADEDVAGRGTSGTRRGF